LRARATTRRSLRAFAAAKQRARAQQRPHAGAPFVDVGRRCEHRVGAGLECAHPLSAQLTAHAQDGGDEVRADVGLQALHQIDAAAGSDAVVD